MRLQSSYRNASVLGDKCEADYCARRLLWLLKVSSCGVGVVKIEVMPVHSYRPWYGAQ